MTIVVITSLTVILYTACKVCRNQLIDISAASSDNLNALSLKHILGALAHIAGQHHHHSHLP